MRAFSASQLKGLAVRATIINCDGRIGLWETNSFSGELPTDSITVAVPDSFGRFYDEDWSAFKIRNISVDVVDGFVDVEIK